MKGRTPTAEERRHLERVAAVGCVVCLIHHHEETPCEIHHLDGKTKPGAHKRVIPLCYLHHRSGRDDLEVTSRHSVNGKGGRRAFENRYGTEAELLEATERLLA